MTPIPRCAHHARGWTAALRLAAPAIAACLSLASPAWGQIQYTGKGLWNPLGTATFDAIVWPDWLGSGWFEAGLKVSVQEYAFQWQAWGFDPSGCFYPNGGSNSQVVVVRTDGKDFGTLQFQCSNGKGQNYPCLIWARLYNNGVPVKDLHWTVPHGAYVGITGGGFDEVRMGDYDTIQARDAHNPKFQNTMALDYMAYSDLSPQGILSCTNGVLDASQAVGWSAGLTANTTFFGVERGVGQVFQANVTGVLDEVVVVLRDTFGSADITPRLNVYALPGPGLPAPANWLPITSAKAGPSGYASTSPQPYTFALSGVTVKAGEYYAFVVTGGNAILSNQLDVLAQSSGNPYPQGGAFITKNKSPGNPQSASLSATALSPDTDLAFQTCIIPSTGPGFCAPKGRAWIDVSPQNHCNLHASIYPESRMQHQMAYDRNNQVVVMFGGIVANYGGVLDDTWYWDGQSWTADHSPNRPPARSGHGMAWDPHRGRVVLYGGADGPVGFDDMWEWMGPGLGWSQIGTGMPPGARAVFGMATDDSRNLVVLDGGRLAPAWPTLDDTWEWDGASWTLASGVMPVGRGHHTIAYHPMYSKGGGMLMFGGWSSQNGFLGDTWAWLPTWRKTKTGPSKRFWSPSVFDSSSEKVVLYGGLQTVTYYNDTWTWDDQGLAAPGAWTKVKPPVNPGRRAMHAMAYDEARNEIVLFGGEAKPSPCGLVGDNQTWVARPCFLDWDGDWVGNTPNDQLLFMTAYNNGDLCADCDGDAQITYFDYLCFTNLQSQGCQ